MILLRRHPFLMLAFALALGVTLFFAGRFVVQVVYWSNPAHQNQQVQGWMTVGYIGKSWRVPPREIEEIAGLAPPIKGKPLTLEQIAADRGVLVSEVVSEVENALALLIARRVMDGALPK
ncbi:MAG: hypothetical protein ACK4RZ_07195 [Paracoccaceae bacterium]